VLLSRARRLTRSGQAVLGLAAAERAVALDPTDVDALLERALALDALGRTAEARRAFLAVLATAPDHPAARAYVEPDRPAEPAAPGIFRLRIDASADPAPAAR
jgi:Flp pilus assembly protein TadD